MYFCNEYVAREIDKELTAENVEKAKKLLEENIVLYDIYKKPVLTTGKGYPGIWIEHNHDSMYYAHINPEIAKNSHRIFYDFQSADGLFPAYICKWAGNDTHMVGYGHLQTVYPLAASALYVAKLTKDEKFLKESYEACAKYDKWIEKYRNTRGSGLAEIFCEYDTGHDNSPRVSDMPLCCPEGDARVCNPDGDRPVIAPDLSAMVYMARLSLSEMAEILGKTEEAEQWKIKAEETKKRIHEVCYDAEDEFYYDVGKDGKFRKYIGEHIFRMFVNNVIDKDIFDKIFDRYIINPDHFLTKYPFPSISASAPYFSKRESNNWGGNTQTHTAFETLYWTDFYDKTDLQDEICTMWLNFINEKGIDACTQEIDPHTGRVSYDAPGFTTALIMYIEFAKRMGIVK